MNVSFVCTRADQRHRVLAYSYTVTWAGIYRLEAGLCPLWGNVCCWAGVQIGDP